jgi:hypothetical protein
LFLCFGVLFFKIKQSKAFVLLLCNNHMTPSFVLVFSKENKAFSSFHDEAIRSSSSRSEERSEQSRRSDLSHYFYEIKAIKTTGKSDLLLCFVF